MTFKNLKTLDMWQENVQLLYDRDECIGCGICVQVCPKEAFRLNPTGASLKGYIKEDPATLNPDKCVLCGVCVALCPEDALKILVNGKEKTLIVENKGLPGEIKFEGEISVDQSKCPRGCRTCEDICREKAIKINDEIKIDETKCTYCGSCVVVCPSEAIKLKRTKLLCEDTGTRIMERVRNILIGEVRLENMLRSDQENQENG